jgi:AmmeMemoRadiSam system protein B
MELIEKNDTKGFDQYIQKTENTICGEFPIRILMHTINNSKNYQNITTKFVRYDQSDKVKSFNGSSVSYAAGVTYLK